MWQPAGVQSDVQADPQADPQSAVPPHLSSWQVAVLAAAWIFAAVSVTFFGVLGTLIETAADPCIGGACGNSAHVTFIVASVIQAALLAGATFLATRSRRRFGLRVGACLLAGLLAPVVLVIGAYVATTLV